MEEILRKDTYNSISIGKDGKLITLEVDYDSGSEYSTGRINLTKEEIREVIKKLNEIIE